jgi:hypothetical protein
MRWAGIATTTDGETSELNEEGQGKSSVRGGDIRRLSMTLAALAREPKATRASAASRVRCQLRDSSRARPGPSLMHPRDGALRAAPPRALAFATAIRHAVRSRGWLPSGATIRSG